MYIAILLTIAAIAFRLITAFFGVGNDWAPNFAPLAAIALCGACYLPRRLAFAVPLGALFLSDLLLSAHYGAAVLTWEMAVRYVALALIAWIGFGIASRHAKTGGSPVLPLLGGSLLGSILFHLSTNTVSWLSSPGYSKSFLGWVQSWTVGLPEFQPQAWVFFRNTAIGDLLFTALFIACMWAVRRPSAQRAAAGDSTAPNAAPAGN